MDARGFGETTFVDDAFLDDPSVYGLDKWGDDLVALLEAWEIPAAVFFGSGLGAIASWILGVMHPTKVVALGALGCTHDWLGLLGVDPAWTDEAKAEARLMGPLARLAKHRDEGFQIALAYAGLVPPPE